MALVNLSCWKKRRYANVTIRGGVLSVDLAGDQLNAGNLPEGSDQFNSLQES